MGIMGGMFVSLLNSYIETLIPNVVMVGGEAFGRWLGQEDGGWGMGLVPL